MEAKKQLLKDTFESAFDMTGYERFIKEFFNAVEIVAPYNKKKNTWSEFSFNITSYSYVANYTDNEQNRIAILAVELKTGKNVERARSAQRNFVSKLITNSGHDAAIVAFYPENNSKTTDENASKWRLSFVKLDQEWLGEGKVKTTITPAKRYSYLVGEKEPCHTAQEQLFPIFKDENYKPTLAKIEEAFSVEAVTDEFFKEYKEKYHELREHLEKSEEFLEAAEKHEFTSEQFAKKLMGQLAFLYFIQKKGWLGVKVVKKSLTEKEYRDAFYKTKYSKIVIPKAYEQKGLDLYKLKASALTGDYLTDDEAERLASCFNSEPWGSGTKSFIRELFNNCIKSGKNFFEDFLEPLFYEALSIKRGDHHYYKRFNCKIPFLNGGLFDPIENYDWKYTTFDIPNSMFSNEDEKGKQDCDGILDIFERYNFTMNEDEPLEREVAVDPEMLGKIFENLLDSDDRKSKGAFYTPREIVHYMCQESLINYLINETKIPYEDLKQFILYGEIMKDEDCGKTMNINNEEIRRLPKTVFENLREIDIALQNVKIADPAVGSGAFPLGMLSEIVKARENITAYIATQIINQDKNSQKSQRAAFYESRSPYKIKWKTIKNSIYGVDIEASAVDIAKLRLWLSLIVDEDLTPSYNDICCGNTTQIDPKPLPNLDYNIMCGNSLIDEFDGIKLFDDSLFDKDESVNKKQSKNMQITLFQDQMELHIEKLFNEQDRLFGENNTDNKKYLKKEIDKTIDHIIRSKLTNDGNNEGLEKYEESLKQKTKPYFLWKLEFAKIFKEKGGFDIVIGNPPYIGFHNVPNKEYFKMKFKSANGKYDFYVLFIEKGINLIKKSGYISYICPSYFYKRNYGEQLRKLILEEVSIKMIADFQDSQIFHSATTYTCVFGFEKYKNNGQNKIKIVDKDLNKDKYFEIVQSSLTEPIWMLNDVDNIKFIEKVKIKAQYTFSDITKSISQGIVTGNNSVFILSEEFIVNREMNYNFLKPVFKGKDIRGGLVDNKQYLFYPYEINEFGKNELIDESEIQALNKNLYDYLVSQKDVLFSREYFKKSNKKWYELWNPRKKLHFKSRKFVFSEINAYNDFILCDECYYSDSACGAELESSFKKYEKYIEKYLNSAVLTRFYKLISVPKANGYLIYKNAFLKELPVYIPNNYEDISEIIEDMSKESYEKWLKTELDLEKI